jgi:hypothetical protein
MPPVVLSLQHRHSLKAANDGRLAAKGCDVAELAVAERSEFLPRHGVSLNEAFRVWFKVALLSFGGPTAQIAVMHRILVDEER